MSYKFTLHDGENIVLPCTYRTRNPDGTRTPIDLRGKRLVLQFVPRSASPILVLDSNASPNANGSGIAITNDVSGRYTVTITAADIATMPVGMWGRSVLNLSTVQRPLWDLPFSKR